ncbi:MAG: very short patch repair endonuclease [Holophagales bacterium]|jgi:DNA mismatch endonuclease (patch repair protein)|nr:very short patch repair endonuclease [Holophagales bacterium]
MTDVHTPEQRSRNMASIRNKDTKPEKIVRSLVHKLGYRYRLHRCGLPGKPDLVFPSRRKLIFVHGCFWHMHNCPYGRVTPATNSTFWQEKRQTNRDRDAKTLDALVADNWSILVVWECETKDREALNDKLENFLLMNSK